jgi:cytochrome c oxidase assembly factor CtaG/polyferredoxin
MPDSLGTRIAFAWVIPFWPTCFLLLTLVIYMRGWLAARLTRARQLPDWRALCFVGGLLSLWLAIASPLDALGGLLLSAHMAQHFILMSVAPPLIVLGAPTVPLLRGLPKSVMQEIVAPWSGVGWIRKSGKFIFHPAFGWLSMNLAYVGWHIPAAYELTLRSTSWHEVEHGCFFFTSVLFWWTVIQPWPSQAHFDRWLVVPYMLGAGIVNTALCGAFSFSGHVFYPAYTRVPRLFGISAMQDQITAGVGMWVIGDIFLFGPMMVIVSDLLSKRRRRPQRLVILEQKPEPQRFDLLRVRGIGPLLRSRYGRIFLQSISLLVCSLVIAHGLFGHQMGAMNLAGVVPWNVVRVFGVLALLFAGNLYCMACPFMLPRELTRLLKLPRRTWPVKLRRKWIGAALMLLFFFAFEQWSIWDVPRRTAAVLLGYFLAAFLVDAIFTGASFCKYICPIGQFNFVSSLVSPLELSVRNKSVCSSCITRDCVRGNRDQRGCELKLFPPQKVGNVDCTLCMDCVKACPHENIGVAAMNPVRDLLRDPQRSSVGRLSNRRDVATIARVIVYGGFGLAFVMISPVVDALSSLHTRFPSLGAIFAQGTCLAAFVLTLTALESCITKATNRFGILAAANTRTISSRFALGLLPLGLTMWAAHLIFHLGTGLPSLWPSLQQAVSDLTSLPVISALHLGGSSNHALHYPLGIPHWATGSGIQAETLEQIQFVLLDAGFLISLYVGWKLALQFVGEQGRPILLWATWALPVSSLYALGLWILTQPMDMGGMVMS